MVTSLSESALTRAILTSIFKGKQIKKKSNLNKKQAENGVRHDLNFLKNTECMVLAKNL